MTQPDTKVNIIELLSKIDNGDLYYWRNLTDEQRKGVSMYVINRWMACTKNSQQIVSINRLVNPFVFLFNGKHDELLYMLMIVSSSGTEKNYRWISKANNKKATNRIKLLSEYYGISQRHAAGYISSFTVDELCACAEQLGYPDEEIKKIKNECK